MIYDPNAPIRGAIVAMNEDRIIGLDGGLPWHYPEDFKRFKQTTINSTIIMGRITWESINCQHLPKRTNIVISRNKVEGVTHYHDIEQALTQHKNENIWIIGGGQIYQAALPYLTLLDITYIPDKIATAHTVKFPKINTTQWQAVKKIEFENSPLKTIVYHRIKH